jgi:hypothetical protein
VITNNNVFQTQGLRMKIRLKARAQIKFARTKVPLVTKIK